MNNDLMYIKAAAACTWYFVQNVIIRTKRLPLRVQPGIVVISIRGNFVTACCDAA
jgi:hypothetical protein